MQTFSKTYLGLVFICWAVVVDMDMEISGHCRSVCTVTTTPVYKYAAAIEDLESRPAKQQIMVCLI